MKSRIRQSRDVVLVGLLIVALVGILIVLHGPTGLSRTPTSQGATETPTQESPDPIYDAQDAINRSLARFPSGHSPHAEEARLISLYDMEVWLAGVEPPQATPAMGDFEWDGTDPDDPVWLVGILGDGLTDGDIVRPPLGLEVEGARPAPGGFYVWDANSGSLLVEGAFLEAGMQTYDTFVALASQPLQIVPATPVPTLPYGTPLPTFTWAPRRLATVVAQLTQQAMYTPTP